MTLFAVVEGLDVSVALCDVLSLQKIQGDYDPCSRSCDVPPILLNPKAGILGQVIYLPV